MSRLDEALQKYIADENEQEQYYRLFLETDFYVPLAEDQGGEGDTGQQDHVTPLVVESEEKPYLLLFDSEERLSAWAKGKVRYAILSGALLADFTPDGLNWAVNLGDTFAKEFVPEEIGWLKELKATSTS